LQKGFVGSHTRAFASCQNEAGVVLFSVRHI
jgi:hypothetical protein